MRSARIIHDHIEQQLKRVEAGAAATIAERGPDAPESIRLEQTARVLRAVLAFIRGDDR